MSSALDAKQNQGAAKLKCDLVHVGFIGKSGCQYKVYDWFFINVELVAKGPEVD